MASTPDLVVAGAGILTLRWTYGASGAGGMNVLGVAITGAVPVNQTLANNLDAAIKAALTSSGLVARLHTTTSLVSCGIRDIRAAHMTEFIGSGAPVVGTGTGDPLPRGVAYCVSLKTAFSGASYRGRVYLGGFTEAVNDTGSAALAAVGTEAVTFVTLIDTALGSNGCDLAVVSRPSYPVTITTVTTVPGGPITTDVKTLRARPGGVTPMTAVVARNLVWDSQRRRTTAGSVSTLFSPVTAVAEKGGQVATPGVAGARHR